MAPKFTSFFLMVLALALASVASNTHAQGLGFARFDELSDTIRIHGNTSFAQGDFTYEMRVRMAPGSALGQVISEQRDTYEDKSVVLSAAGDYVASSCSGGPTGDFSGTFADFPGGVWIHFAYVKHGSEALFFVDGTLRRTETATFCFGDAPDSWMSLGMFVYGAGYIPTGPKPSFLGDLDWIRVSSTARYAASFSPPFECEIAPDLDTELLLKFNEPAGTARLTDESPNQFLCDLGIPVTSGFTATNPTLGHLEGGYPECACLVDTDGDGVPDCDDGCPLNPERAAPIDFYADMDSDGFGAGSPVPLCDAIAGFVTNNADCNDSNAAVNPGAQELCDLLNTDEDCDGFADNADPSAADASKTDYFTDGDDDNYGTGSAQRFCDEPSFHALFAGDCNDSNPAVNPGAQEVCDPLNTDEDCNGLADNFDPNTDPSGRSRFFFDGDCDGYGDPSQSRFECDPPWACSVGESKWIPILFDCNDSNPAVNPGAPELCNGGDDDCDGSADEQCTEVTLAMALVPSVIEPAGEIVVRIGAVVDSHAIFPLVGLQSAIRFDASRLAFVDATPVDGSPLPLEIAQIADSDAGTLLYAIGAMPPSSGVAGSAALLDIRFAIRPEAELCAQDVQLVWFEGVAGWDTKFTMGGGAAVIPTLVPTAPIDLDEVAPVLVAVPSPTTVPADAGRLGAFVADPGVTATDACGAPAIAIAVTVPSGATTPGWPADGVFPIGTSLVRWTATDAQGNSSSAEATVTVEDHQLVDLALELVGAFDPDLPPFERTIRVQLGGTHSASTRSFAPDPMDPAKRRASISSLEIPATETAPCVVAKDAGFSLSDAASAGVAGTRYAASLSLLQGDSNDDDAVDIIDFGLWFVDVGPAAATSRSNFNADGFVNPADFGWIGVHFFRRGEACGGGLAGGEPIRRISVKDLRRRGLGELAAADLNRDGWLDLRDVSASSSFPSPSLPELRAD